MKFLKKLAVLVVVALGLFAGSTHAQQMNQVVQDTFQRGNESPLADYGNWSVAPFQHGTDYYPVVSNNRLQASVGGDVPNSALWTGISWKPDQFAEIIVQTKGDYDFDCVQVRASTTAPTFYQLCLGVTTPGPLGSSTTATIVKSVNGTATTLKSFTINNSVVGVPTYLRVQGTTLSVDFGGTILGTITDSSIASGVPGVSLYTASTSTLSTNLVSSFMAGTMTTANSGLPCGQSGYGTYNTTSVQFQGDAAISQVSASGGYATFYVGATGIAKPAVNETVNIYNVSVGGADMFDGTYQIYSVGTTVNNYTPVTVQLPSGFNPSVSLTTLTHYGLFDSHIQFINSISLTNNLVTVNVANNLVANQSVEIGDANNTIYNGVHTVYSATPTAFTYQFTHSNIASENETNEATVVAIVYGTQFTTEEGQASGSLSCITSNFQNAVSLGTTIKKGPQYTPGQHATYTAAFTLPCDFIDCTGGGPGGVESGGGVDCFEAGTCGGGNIYVPQCPCDSYQIEVASTRYHTNQPPQSTLDWTTNYLFFTETWGLFPSTPSCTADTTPPDLNYPELAWIYKFNGSTIPGLPANYGWQGALCSRYVSGPLAGEGWFCFPILWQVPLSRIEGVSGVVSHCTKHP